MSLEINTGNKFLVMIYKHNGYFDCNHFYLSSVFCCHFYVVVNIKSLSTLSHKIKTFTPILTSSICSMYPQLRKRRDVENDK